MKGSNSLAFCNSLAPARDPFVKGSISLTFCNSLARTRVRLSNVECLVEHRALGATISPGNGGPRRKCTRGARESLQLHAGPQLLGAATQKPFKSQPRQAAPARLNSHLIVGSSTE